MRSFIDKDKKIAWIFDESTHPSGLLFKKDKSAVVAEKVVAKEEPAPAKKSYFGKKK